MTTSGLGQLPKQQVQLDVEDAGGRCADCLNADTPLLHDAALPVITCSIPLHYRIGIPSTALPPA